MKSYRSVSLSDLITSQKWVEAEKNNDAQAKKEILYALGLDVEKGVEEEYVQHRNWQNQVVKCIRYTGEERQDKQWLRSGHASVEAHIASADDETRKDMLMMSRQLPYAYALSRGVDS